MTVYTCFTDQADELQIHDTHWQVTRLTKLQDIERVPLCNEQDLLVYVCSEMIDVDLQLLLRIMKFAPIPVIVNAKYWQKQALTRLLECGRVTFVPGELEPGRVEQVIELAKLRFSLANEQKQKLLQLESSLEAQKLLAKVKSRLQQNGLSESQAHKLLQKQAMDSGISVEQLVHQLPLS
ncbi:ANTAR domain-containing protein [Shewanella eurypsychrophilus]|uniref:ANTAR domain-containing protein n=1 Tax=Shewanella eurypsychrophilus TaxID=2593656 RepID=A0ABX6V500_9GAMM|nr:MULTISPECIES: ANTAR domain-containing protein [Shewanella]QFU22344.1 ANTAR domain-containing protein [Shewanella sp. YLB-09]QPG57630.1 ANTAR domain-containing protein [Shewanella eurypsychrophilus]